MKRLTLVIFTTLLLGSGFTTAAPLTNDESKTTTQSVVTSFVNINTASLEQLKELPGIGQSKAQAIIAFREKNGAFLNVEDLLNVKGIGNKMLEKLSAQVVAE